MDSPVVDGAPGAPALEDRLDGAPQLIGGIVGKGLARPGLNDGLELPGEGREIVGGEVDVALNTPPALRLLQHLRERLLAQLEHDVAVHLDEAAIRVVGEARVPRPGDQALHRLVVQAEV